MAGKDSKWEVEYTYKGTSVVLFIFINIIGSTIFDSIYSAPVYMFRHHEAQYYILYVVQLDCSSSAVTEQHYSDWAI